VASALCAQRRPVVLPLVVEAPRLVVLPEVHASAEVLFYVEEVSVRITLIDEFGAAISLDAFVGFAPVASAAAGARRGLAKFDMRQWNTENFGQESPAERAWTI